MGLFFFLIAALIAIKKGKRGIHKRFMLTALILSVIFLISYVFHHATHDSVSYGGRKSKILLLFYSHHAYYLGNSYCSNGIDFFF